MERRAEILDYSLALTSGVLLALSFPRFGHPAFAWIALVPLLIALTGWRGRPGPVPGQAPQRAFGLGLTAGFVYFVGTLYWTGDVVRTFGGLAAPVALLAMALLSAYLALFPALTALIVSRLLNCAGIAALWLTPAAWISTEFVRGYLFGGFPWVPLGNSQVEVLPVAQLASVLGVYGVSALVAFINAAIAVALLAAGRQRILAIATAVIVLVAVGGWGSRRIAGGSLTREGTPLRVGLVQGNIAQADKWNPREARRIFTTHVAMTRDVVRRGAEYVLWPESSTPFMFEEDDAGEAAVRALAREVGVPILLGSDQIVRDGIPRMYNAAFLVTPEGETASGVPQDPPRAVRRVHPHEELADVRLAAGGQPRRVRARRLDGDDPGWLAPDEHRHLLRGCVSLARAAGCRRRQPAADDHHQRRLVRTVVRAIPALRARIDAGDRAGPLPGAGGEHGDQRCGGSVRTHRPAVGYL